MKRTAEELQLCKNAFRKQEGKDTKVLEVQSRWNQVHLFLVCGLLAISLITLLDCCRSPSDPWLLLGSAGLPLWDWMALCMVFLFCVLQILLYHLPVGKVVEGKLGSNGAHLKYKLNGLQAFLLSSVLLLGLWWAGLVRAAAVTDRLFALVTAGTGVSLLLSLVLYLCPASTPDSVQVYYLNSAQSLLNFALGQNLDPRLGEMDLKQFVMVRIGFIGWATMDLVYLLTAVEMKDSWSVHLLLVVIFHLTYILDFLIDEESVLTTKEFTEEPIGFIMILGEFIWIPFFSSLPVYFLLHRPSHTDVRFLLPICLLFGTGFLIYYLSNEQKDAFRKNPHDPAFARMDTIQSPSGKRLLVSGWFGWVRHPNYLGDIMMMFAWSLPCGFRSVLPYLPAIQCFHLLRDRANEIEKSCLKKHKEAWREYCRRVPYKLLPNIY